MIQKCKECRETFVITQGEKHFYTAKKLSLPRRCEKCRRANREKAQGNHPFEGKLDDFKHEQEEREN